MKKKKNENIKNFALFIIIISMNFFFGVLSVSIDDLKFFKDLQIVFCIKMINNSFFLFREHTRALFVYRLIINYL